MSTLPNVAGGSVENSRPEDGTTYKLGHPSCGPFRHRFGHLGDRPFDVHVEQRDDSPRRNERLASQSPVHVRAGQGNRFVCQIPTAMYCVPANGCESSLRMRYGLRGECPNGSDAITIRHRSSITRWRPVQDRCRKSRRPNPGFDRSSPPRTVRRRRGDRSGSHGRRRTPRD